MEVILFLIGVGVLIYSYVNNSRYREFKDVKYQNPKLWKKIEKEASSHFDKSSKPLQEDWDDLTRKIYDEYKKGLAMGSTVKQIYKERKKTTFGPWKP